MRKALIAFFLIPLLAAAAAAQTPDDTKAVRDINLRLQVLLYRLYELSSMNPPRGTNAASGAWRDKVAADPKLEDLYKYPVKGLTGDAANTDPVCGLSPHHNLVTDVVDRAQRPVAPAVQVKPLVFRDDRNSRSIGKAHEPQDALSKTPL